VQQGGRGRPRQQRGLSPRVAWAIRRHRERGTNPQACSRLLTQPPTHEAAGFDSRSVSKHHVICAPAPDNQPRDTPEPPDDTTALQVPSRPPCGNGEAHRTPQTSTATAPTTTHPTNPPLPPTPLTRPLPALHGRRASAATVFFRRRLPSGLSRPSRDRDALRSPLSSRRNRPAPQQRQPSHAGARTGAVLHRHPA